MPPRKAVATEGQESAPRRSTRISSQPVTEPSKTKKSKAITKTATKRSAGEDDAKASNKKVRS